MNQLQMINRMLRGGATPIPTNGLWGWYMANEGVIKDSNDLISQWNDQSGNGNHATQTDINKRPLYSANQINGLPVVYFSGSKSLSFPLLSTTTCSIYIVYKKINANSAGVLLADATSNTISGCFDWVDSNIYFNTPNLNVGVGGGGNTTYTLLNYNYASGVNISIYKNTNNIYNQTPSSSSFISNSVGFWQYANAYLSGNIAEVIIKNIYDSTNDRQLIESYLNTKYGL